MSCRRPCPARPSSSSPPPTRSSARRRARVLFGFFDFRPDRLVGDDHFDQTYQGAHRQFLCRGGYRAARVIQGQRLRHFNWSRNDTFQPGINTTALTAAAGRNNDGDRARSVRHLHQPGGRRGDPQQPDGLHQSPAHALGAIKIDGRWPRCPAAT